ncbi:MAG: protein kinase domain-containing protein [Povalibacter sp.]
MSNDKDSVSVTPEGAGVDPAFARMEALFNEASVLPKEEQAAFVLAQTPDDPELRDEVLAMLALDNGRRTSPLTHALGAAFDVATRDRRKALLGKVVGNYRLTEVLGHGGTGTVYLGERADRQYSAQVAVKVVDGATVHPSLGMRLRAERQILASLNHQNIAKLLDAGEIEDGRPYLVMEYVHGKAVDQYADDAQLDLRGRLELFLDICSAVQYAHQNLIVHRDLKPANILVTPEGTPKLLDFGIAKLLDASDQGTMLAMTRMNDRLLTPEYASPEQILGRVVTTASDVYALGVVLYELLTGLRPYVVPASASQLELERCICVADPLRPSAAVRRAIESNEAETQSLIDSLAAARRLPPDRLLKRLIGDLDAIVLRAMRKEPDLRYNSVEQFAADVRRYLEREPVQARQGNWMYYSARFARRNAVGVAATSAFIVFLISFAVVMSIQRQRIVQERDRATQEGERAERVSDFMLRVFTAADPFENSGKQMTASELLEQAARTIQGELGQQPEVRARLLEAIGRAYRRQGQSGRAVTFLEESLRVRRRANLPEDAQTGQVFSELAVALRNDGRFDESDHAFHEAIRIAETQSGKENSLTRAGLLADLGRLELVRSNLDKAEPYFTQALAIMREEKGLRDPEVASILLDMASVRAWRDDLDGAERAAREAVSIYQESIPLKLHPDRVMANSRLAEVLFLKGKIDEAGDLYQSVLDSQRVLYGSTTSQVADTLDSLGQIRLAQNKLAEAEKLTREAIQVNTQARGKDYYMTGYLRTSLAQILTRQGHLHEAESELREALDLYSRSLPSDHQYVPAAEYLLGELLLATHRLPDAEAVLTASMNRWKRTSAPAWRSARSASALGETLYREGRIQEAEKYLVQSFRDLTADNGADADTRRKARERVARFYTDRGQRQKLEELMLATNQNAVAPRNLRPN